MTTTTTAPSPIFTELNTIHGFMRATAGDLPDPASITMCGISAEYLSVSLLFDSVDELNEWAAYLQVEVSSHWSDSTKRVHRNAKATWGPTQGKFVQFDMAYLEPVHVCSEDCNPGNCEVEHAKQSGILPMDCEAV
ncbi:MAG TPA: hypothetical protein VFH56_11215 [Acidimicrobiales bacterium]|nr:hypothetical protein [Acidimicrobiales bacterium]